MSAEGVTSDLKLCKITFFNFVKDTLAFEDNKQLTLHKMPNLTRSKRKLEVQTNVRDNKVLKAKGTDGTGVKKDWNVQLKSLNQKYDALVVENSENLERIKHLTEKVKILENDNLPKSTTSIECQTRSKTLKSFIHVTFAYFKEVWSD